MKVRAIRSSREGCPKQILLHIPKKVPITISKDYEVHAIAAFRDYVLFQFVDDWHFPGWLPAWLFEVQETSIPTDWICNILSGYDNKCLILGPEFIAKDAESYDAMVDLEPDPVKLFWKRVDELGVDSE